MLGGRVAGVVVSSGRSLVVVSSLLRGSDELLLGLLEELGLR